MLWFVRHAPVEPQLDRPASTWELTPEGRADAEELARRLGPVARVVSSPEAKAVATAEPIARVSGVELELDERLREVRRETNAPTYEAHRAAVRRYFEGEAVDGWEPREEALTRFRAAVDGVDGAAVVTHATVLSLFLGYGFEQWKRIALPDVIAWP
jgi:2,3-bisphosphoglycerate-dependent phosphoglycerate mutase